MSDPILRTQNYYAGRARRNPETGKITHEKKDKDVYLSDLMNNKKCWVSFSAYRDTDNIGADVKISLDNKNGIVRSYNPETGLLAVDCVKKRPSRLSTVFKRTNKLRYVAPEYITVSSVSGGNCLLRPVVQSRSASRGTSSPRGTTSPRGASSPRSASSPRGASSPRASTPRRRGGRMRITRKKRQTGK